MPRDPFDELPDSIIPAAPEALLHTIEKPPKPPPWLRRDYSRFLSYMNRALESPNKSFAVLAGATERLAKNFRLEFYRARAAHRQVSGVKDKYDALTFTVVQTNKGWAVQILHFEEQMVELGVEVKELTLEEAMQTVTLHNEENG